MKSNVFTIINLNNVKHANNQAYKIVHNAHTTCQNLSNI